LRHWSACRTPSPRSASADPHDSYQRYADAVKKGFAGQVFIAQDLAEF
jgi:hypothetical protein